MSEYERGFQAGWAAYQMYADERRGQLGSVPYYRTDTKEFEESSTAQFYPRAKPKRKRKLSAWNKFVKANANKPRFKYKSGAKKENSTSKNGRSIQKNPRR